MGRILRLEDKEVGFKKLNFMGNEGYYTPFALGFQNNMGVFEDEEKRQKQYDVYFDAITDVWDFGYILNDTSNGHMFYIGGTPIYTCVFDTSKRELLDVYPQGEYGNEASIKLMGITYKVVGTIIGYDLPRSIGKNKDNERGLGIVMSANDIAEFYNAKEVSKSAVVDKVIETFKMRRERFDFAINMLTFASKSFRGKVGTKEVLETISNMIGHGERTDNAIEKFVEDLLSDNDDDGFTESEDDE